MMMSPTNYQNQFKPLKNNIMKKVVSVFLVVIVTSIAFKQDAQAQFLNRCVSAQTSITGPSTMDWQAGEQYYSSQTVCDAVEYEWTLNVGTSCPMTQIQLTPNVTLSPYDFGFLHNAICGTWTISVRAKIDDGVNPPYWTSYITKTVTVTGCP